MEAGAEAPGLGLQFTEAAVSQVGGAEQGQIGPAFLTEQHRVEI